MIVVSQGIPILPHRISVGYIFHGLKLKLLKNEKKFVSIESW
jgi:hypothetical protein